MSLGGIGASGNDAYLKAYMQYMQNAAPADTTAAQQVTSAGSADSTTFTGNGGKSNSNTSTYAWMGLTALAAVGIYLLTRGKGKKAAGEVAKDTTSKLTCKQRKNAKKAIERQLELERSERFTPEELVAYGEEFGYKAPSAQRRKIMRKNNREATKANHKAHELRNNAKWTSNTPKQTPKPPVAAGADEIKNLQTQLNIAKRKAASYIRMGKQVNPQIQNEIDKLTKLIELNHKPLDVVV